MKKLWYSFAMLLALAMTVSFAACSSDDDNKESEKQKEETGVSNVTYMVYASNDLINYFDLVMNYTGQQGSTLTKTLTKSDFKEKTINGVSIPCAEVNIGEITLGTVNEKALKVSFTLQRNSNTDVFTTYVPLLAVYLSATNAKRSFSSDTFYSGKDSEISNSQDFLTTIPDRFNRRTFNFNLLYSATGNISGEDGDQLKRFTDRYSELILGWKSGSKVDLANTRAFILNEGTLGKNNSNIIYFDWATNTVNTSCIYNQQNGKLLGDTGNDLITYDEGLLVTVNGSNYVAWLNGSAVEKKRMSFADYTNLGLVRDITFDEDDQLFVSTTGGYVAYIDNRNGKFAFEDSIKVGTYPEDVIYFKGNVYCAVSGWGADNRVAIIDTEDYTVKSYIDVMVNPDNLVKCDEHLFVQGYGPYAADYSCPYPWGEITDGTYKELGNASKIAAGNGKVFTALSQTNWSTYTTTTTLAAYDVATGTTDTGFFKNAPSSIATTNVYSISVNPYTNYVYVASGDGYSEGTIHVFNAEGNYQASFACNGYCPNTIVFLKN